MYIFYRYTTALSFTCEQNKPIERQNNQIQVSQLGVSWHYLCIFERHACRSRHQLFWFVHAWVSFGPLSTFPCPIPWQPVCWHIRSGALVFLLNNVASTTSPCIPQSCWSTSTGLGNSKKLKTPINTEHIIFIDIDEENRILGSQARAKCWTDTALGPPIAKMLCITVRHAG